MEIEQNTKLNTTKPAKRQTYQPNQPTKPTNAPTNMKRHRAWPTAKHALRPKQSNCCWQQRRQDPQRRKGKFNLTWQFWLGAKGFGEADSPSATACHLGSGSPSTPSRNHVPQCHKLPSRKKWKQAFSKRKVVFRNRFWTKQWEESDKSSTFFLPCFFSAGPKASLRVTRLKISSCDSSRGLRTSPAPTLTPRTHQFHMCEGKASSLATCTGSARK